MKLFKPLENNDLDNLPNESGYRAVYQRDMKIKFIGCSLETMSALIFSSDERSTL